MNSCSVLQFPVLGFPYGRIGNYSTGSRTLDTSLDFINEYPTEVGPVWGGAVLHGKCASPCEAACLKELFVLKSIIILMIPLLAVLLMQ